MYTYVHHPAKQKGDAHRHTHTDMPYTQANTHTKTEGHMLGTGSIVYVYFKIYFFALCSIKINLSSILYKPFAVSGAK